jgi:hypothetical protein
MRKFSDPIVLVPNTGYRLLFFPIKLDPNKPVPRQVKDIVDSNREALSGGNLEPIDDYVRDYYNYGWRTPNIAPGYIRMRPGVLEDAFGIWLAIETNLGGNERGWFFDMPPPSPEQQSHFKKERQPRPPYVAKTANDITGERRLMVDLGGCLVELKIEWKDMMTGVVDVDLVVDFGNSRTCALALERGNGLGLSQSIRPIGLRRRFFASAAGKLSVHDSMVSSRFALKTPEFRSMDPDKLDHEPNGPRPLMSCDYQVEREPEGVFGWAKRRITGKEPEFRLTKVLRRVPHMFSQVSPAVLGLDMEDIIDGSTKIGEEARRRMELGERLQQSSAKRYFWDDQQAAISPWSAIPNYGDVEFKSAGLSRLSGLMLRFQPEDGTDWAHLEGSAPHEWDRGRQPLVAPNDPRYPRRNTLTWSILSILESSYRQINDEEWTRTAGAHQRRALRTVIATYPSGWTSTEIENYRLKWLEAIRIFQVTHLPESEAQIELVMNLDEAVASQLPVIYSAMTRMSGRVVGENWTSLHGQVPASGQLAQGRMAPHRVRVMNIDIGGGTSDVSVVEYADEREGMQVDLKAEVLFKDSSTAAGDILVRSIIEQIILPKLAEPEPDKLIFAKYFAAEEDATRTAKRVGLLTSVLIPMAIKMLQERSSGQWDGGARRMSLDNWVGQQSSQLRELFREVGAGERSTSSTMLSVGAKELDQLIEDVFGRFARTLAKHASVFDVDLLIVCGKPSEQPAVKNLITRLVPVPTERIFFTRGYRAGNWYPFREGIEGQVADAKSVTCVGAALEHAMSSGVVTGWKLKVTNRSAYRNVWGQMPKSGPRFSVKILEEPEDLSRELVLPIEARIGRKMFDTHAAYPEPVYQLVCTDGSRTSGDVRVVFKRLTPDAESLSPGAVSDGLELASATDPETGEDLTESFRLRLYPVGETESNWQDTGILNAKYESLPR